MKNICWVNRQTKKTTGRNLDLTYGLQVHFKIINTIFLFKNKIHNLSIELNGALYIVFIIMH